MPCGRSFLLPRCWPAYAAFGRKPPADGETLEKPRSRAQLFKRFCAKGDACALRLLTPFISLLAGLRGLSAANRRLARETSEKPRSKAQLFRRFRAWGNGWPHVILYQIEVWRGLLPGRREQKTGFLPARENRSPAWACTQKEPRACEVQMQTQTRCATCPPQARDFSLPGKTEAQRGRAAGKNRGRARLGKNTNPVRDLLTASVNSGCGLRRWCAGSRGPCDCRACRGTRHKPF